MLWPYVKPLVGISPDYSPLTGSIKFCQHYLMKNHWKGFISLLCWVLTCISCLFPIALKVAGSVIPNDYDVKNCLGQYVIKTDLPSDEVKLAHHCWIVLQRRRIFQTCRSHGVYSSTGGRRGWSYQLSKPGSSDMFEISAVDNSKVNDIIRWPGDQKLKKETIPEALEGDFSED